MLTTIVSLDPIYFYFTVDEKSFLKYQGILGIGMGQTQQRQGRADPDRAHRARPKPTRKGTLDFVDNRVDNATGTILLRATVENADGFIKPGPVRHRLACRRPKPYQGVLMPDEAVGANQDKRIVYVVGRRRHGELART